MYTSDSLLCHNNQYHQHDRCDVQIRFFYVAHIYWLIEVVQRLHVTTNWRSLKTEKGGTMSIFKNSLWKHVDECRNWLFCFLTIQKIDDSGISHRTNNTKLFKSNPNHATLISGQNNMSASSVWANRKQNGQTESKFENVQEQLHPKNWWPYMSVKWGIEKIKHRTFVLNLGHFFLIFLLLIHFAASL